jgi:hypothetical protein
MDETPWHQEVSFSFVVDHNAIHKNVARLWDNMTAFIVNYSRAKTIRATKTAPG